MKGSHIIAAMAAIAGAYWLVKKMQKPAAITPAAGAVTSNQGGVRQGFENPNDLLTLGKALSDDRGASYWDWVNYNLESPNGVPTTLYSSTDVPIDPAKDPRGPYVNLDPNAPPPKKADPPPPIDPDQWYADTYGGPIRMKKSTDP